MVLAPLFPAGKPEGAEADASALMMLALQASPMS
jgi:hypothetical protein